MALEDIVNVNVTIATATVSQKGFGIPLLYGHHTAWQDRVRTYKASSWSTQLATDLGPDYAEHPLYLAARALMSQNPRPKEFKIGKRAFDETHTVKLTPTVGGEGYVHSVVVEQADGTTETATFTEGAAGTVAAIVTGLAGAINALNADVTATDNATHVTVAATAPNVYFAYRSMTSTLSLSDDTDDTGVTAAVTTDLDAIWAADSDWYAIGLVSGSGPMIAAVADWVEEKPIIFVPQTQDASTLTASTTDIASTLKTAGYAQTMLMYHSRLFEFAGIAWIGKVLPYEPGQATWKFKTLKGVTPDRLTGDQETKATGKNLAFYSTILGTSIAGEGAAANGTFLDLTQLSHWATARVKENVFGGLAANPKAAFADEQGGAIIYGGIYNMIQQGWRNNSIDRDPDTWGIEVPAASTVTTRAQRKWEGVTAFFKATGAVHSVDTINISMNI